MLTGLSTFWFERTAAIVPNHLVSVTDGVPAEVARPRRWSSRRLEMLPVECVVRGYLTGSGWKDYQRTRRGLRDRAARRACASPTSCPSRSSRRRPRPTSGHDEAIDFEGAVELIGDRALAERVRDVSIARLRARRRARPRARDHPRRHEVRARARRRRRADARRRGAARPTPRASGPPTSTSRAARSRASTSSSCATGRPRPGWDRTPPAPAIPDDVVARTREKYVEAYERITGEPFDAWLRAHRARPPA